jgi:hypothetical protein
MQQLFPTPQESVSLRPGTLRAWPGERVSEPKKASPLAPLRARGVGVRENEAQPRKIT